MAGRSAKSGKESLSHTHTEKEEVHYTLHLKKQQAASESMRTGLL